MKFCELSSNEYDRYVVSSKQKNFLQSSMMIEKYKLDKQEYYLVGVKDDGVVVAATILTASKANKLGFKTFNAFQGILMDYNEKNLLNFITIELKKFIKAKKGFKLYINPYIISQTRDIKGEPIQGENNITVKEQLKLLGYKYIGKKYQVKWMFRMDVDKLNSEEIFKTFSSTKRNIINKTIKKYNLVVRELEYDELKYFKTITLDTSSRRGFKDKSLNYYQNMFKSFNEDIKFIVCELNCDFYLDNLNNILKQNKVKFDKLSKCNSKIKEQEQLKKVIENDLNEKQEIEKLKEKKGNVIPLAAAMFILYGDEVIYLFSGSYDIYMKYKAQYRIQWEMIKYAADNNYKHYNFYGIQNFKNKEGNDYGVYQFKKEFGGYVYELLGTFVLPVNFIGKLHTLKDKVKEF